MSEPDPEREAPPPAGRADDELVRALADFVDDLIDALGPDLDQLAMERPPDGASDGPAN